MHYFSTQKHLSFIFIVLSVVLIGLGIFANSNEMPFYSLETEIHIYGSNNEDVAFEIAGDEISLSIDFIFKSSAELEGDLILLRNFKPCSFSLNGSEYTENYKIKIPSSEKYISSRKNCIEIKNLNLTSNDMCLILIVDDIIVNKRFQITNSTSDKKMNFVNQDYFPLNQKNENVSWFMSDHSSFIDFKKNPLYLEDVIRNRGLCCALSIRNKLMNSQFELDFENRRNEGIQYAIVPIGYNGNWRFLEPIFLKTSFDTFGFEMEISDIDDLTGMRFIIFPFANEFNDDHLSTYKAFLWSSPIVTHIILRRA